MSHSKRNTSRAVFTAHERSLAKAAWTSSHARLGRESFLSFGSCSLCLEPARDPVSCHHGDIFCRECALANLIAQKKEIKRVQKSLDNAQKARSLAKAEEDAGAHEREVKDFEMIQAGLMPERSAAASTASNASKELPHNLLAGSKRKVEPQGDELVVRQSEERSSKIRKGDDKRPALASFWTPSLTPNIDPDLALANMKRPKPSPQCPASEPGKPHSFSQKTLIGLEFTEEKDPRSGNEAKRVCPSCIKSLTNASKPLLSRNCGHVMCRPCILRLIKSTGGKDMACYVCDVRLSSETDDKAAGDEKTRFPPSLIELRSEGTGFSATGTNTIDKSVTEFQC